MEGNSSITSNGKSSLLSQRVSYRDLPFKFSLIILMLARSAEPLATSAIQSSLFFQLRHFNPHADPAIIASQAGLLASCRTASHACTGIIWGRFADSEYGGRKPVLIISLLACGIGTLGYGHAPSFGWALAWLLVDGLCNCSIPMVRCMIAELHPEKKYLARSLTLLPLSASFGLSFGPVIAGFLARGDQACGNNQIACVYSFSLPSIVIAGYCAIVAILVFSTIKETSRLDDKAVVSHSNETRCPPSAAAAASTIESSDTTQALENEPLLKASRDATITRRGAAATVQTEEASQTTTAVAPSMRMLGTSHVVYTMLTTFLISGHLGTFGTLWPIFLSSPHHANASNRHAQLSGGLELNSRQVAACMSLLGLPSILLQITIYPILNDKFGAISVWRWALVLFPVAYLTAPLALLAVHSSPSSEGIFVNTPILWGIVGLVITVYITGRTGVNPATTLLINDCTPHPRLRGTVHSIGTIVANLGRSIFPLMILPVFGYGLRVGLTGLGFWCLATLSALACVLSRYVRESGSRQNAV